MADGHELSEFNDLLSKRIAEMIPMQTVWAVCKSVDWEAGTMVATGQVDDLDYYDVSLGRGFEMRKPKAGTVCLLGIEQNQPANAYLIDAEELEEYKLKFGTSEMSITPDGFTIERQGENLFKATSDLIDEICKIIVLYGTSPDVGALNAIKTRFNKILI